MKLLLKRPKHRKSGLKESLDYIVSVCSSRKYILILPVVSISCVGCWGCNYRRSAGASEAQSMLNNSNATASH